ncbi:methyltransferase domain-containing protein [Blochmannia endosymbiont of Colobopsis nipponica]|uniref:class I SAM-dependent methyltransferase n=1 Tax=Blochmannia endosymbiont of Colobopsis nipponica TaxID=2681987 RepID=UPI0017868BC8|nr:methyltransferase domain-containing protein [Blochmannia endosymbiont of Colobopsis nipponica]QOI11196.1 methyltransferase domain-containing protein [Blochmannia endosymbiont of Colobopsis nipponica]
MKSLQNEKLIFMPNVWEDVPNGIYYRKILEKELKNWLPKMRGFNMLKIGALSIDLNINECAVLHQINVGPEGEQFQVIVDIYKLPFANRSVDICLLAHTLSYIAHPYSLLQEVDRILSDDGWLIITTFNLISILGLFRIAYFFFRKAFKMRLYTQMRLLYWLQSLNFEIMYKSHLKSLLREKNDNFYCLLSYLFSLGCLNIIIARKRTMPFQLIPLGNQNYFFNLF